MTISISNIEVIFQPVKIEISVVSIEDLQAAIELLSNDDKYKPAHNALKELLVKYNESE